MAKKGTTKTAKTTKKKTTKKPKSTTHRIKNEVQGRPAKHTGRHIFIAACLIIFPLFVGVISSTITGDAMMSFNSLNQPAFAPPAWLFPIAWTILYLLMGVASYLIYRPNPQDPAEKTRQNTEIILYFTQLLFNFFWTIFFFLLELRFFAFGWLITMWLMILALIILTFKNRKAAAICLIPYLLWCTFAACLNIAIAVLN